MSASQRYLVLAAAFLAIVFDGVELGLMPVASLSVSKSLLGPAFTPELGGEWFARFTAALMLGAAIGLVAPVFGERRARAAFFATAVLASHALLDTLTDGGLGCALLWPYDLTRHFAPWSPIPVAPIGRAFFTERGLHVAATELAIFLPVLGYALWPRSRVVSSPASPAVDLADGEA